MHTRTFFFASLALSIAALTGCTSDAESASSSGPVIDSLDVPAQASTLSVSGQSGPGIILTLTAHDDASGINALHVAFTELGAEHVVNIPNAPTKLSEQKIELVLVGAPKGDHQLGFSISDAQGHTSAVIEKTVTVP